MADTPKRPIVMIAAHPDDVAHGMGGTALLLKDRYALHVLCATKGEGGIKGKSHAEAAAIREKEEAAVCNLLGAQLTFLGLMDGEVFAERAVCERVAGILKELDPAAVFTLWPINVPDHTAVSTIATKALHLADLYFTTDLYFWENEIGGQTNQFAPDIYVNITDVIEQKKELIRCHKSQNPGQDSLDQRIRRNVTRGMLARCDYAEGFRTPHPLVGHRWGRKNEYILLDL